MKEGRRIYLDNAGTTHTSDEVLDAMFPYYTDEYGNPSSLCATGRKAKSALEAARKNIAAVLGSLSEEIIFTGSGTESDNLAILGVARANKKYGNHVLISSVEHKAVLEPARQLEKEGFIVEYIPVDSHGMVNVNDCVSRITDTTILVSVMYANNEIGTIQPIQKLGRAVQELRNKKQEENLRNENKELPNEERRTNNSSLPLLHTDACQAAGYLSLDVTELGVDLMTINGSKIYGPKGVGVLYKNKNVNMEPVIVGGGQEFGFRSGTENLPLIVGMSTALVRVEARRLKEVKRVTNLREYCFSALQKAMPDIVLNGHRTMRLPNNIHISVPHIEGESMVLMLDAVGIEASTGSACSSNDLRVSHVLTAINQDQELMHGSLRLTLGEKTTKEDCDYLFSVLPDIIKRLRSMSPLTLSL